MTLVLVVEDDDDHRQHVRDLLVDNGYEVVEAAGGQQALAYLVGARNIEPALIV